MNIAKEKDLLLKIRGLRLEAFADDKWFEINFIAFDERIDYFLCLPQHKEACLHWLNGGDVLADGEPYWNDAPQEWCNQNDFMSADIEFRTKPKKEKRWVTVKSDALASMIFKSKELAEQAAKGRQVIEIEVEV